MILKKLVQLIHFQRIKLIYVESKTLSIIFTMLFRVYVEH